MNLSLEGKKTIVTGGGHGLCRAIAEAYHEAGAEVVIIGSSNRVYQTAREMSCSGPAVHAVRQDLSRYEGSREAFREAFGLLNDRVDILLNGAGINYRCPAVDFPQGKWEQILNINLNAVFYISQLAGREMVKQGYGKIINIASMTSFFGSVDIPAYSASKGAVAQLTKALSNEWASRGVCVNAIAPGYMETAMTETMKKHNPDQYAANTSRIPMGRWGTADDLKGISVFLASDAAAYITGAVIPVDGGYLCR